MSAETITIPRRPGWTFLASLSVTIECGPLTSPPVKLGMAVRAAFEKKEDLRGAYLRGANLHGADLQGADLHGADLQGADLHGADLQGANLRGAYLRGADLHGADLQGANLQGADLQGADLRDAYLRDADLHGAYLRDADLQDADLRDADLHGAYLRDADLQDAKNIKLPHFQIPQDGALIVWKKTTAGVAKLQVPAAAKRTASIIGRKCRAEFVKVLAAPEGARSLHDSRTAYVKGETVRPDRYDPNPFVECSNGIHFFLTKEEAEEYA